MPITRIKNNQVTDASAGNIYLGINAAVKLQDFSVTAGKIANSLVYGSDLTVTGNLTVNGQTTTIDTVSVVIEDPILYLAANQTGSPSLDIGFIGERGTSQNIAFVWDESAGEFVTVFTNDTTTNSTVTIDSYANFHTNNANIGGNIVINGTTSFVGNIISPVNITGNFSAGNISTPGQISAVGNISTDSQVVATGNITGGNLNTAGQVVATGNVNGGNVNATSAITAGTTINATGNITGGNLSAGSGIISTTGNVNGGNVNATSAITAGTTINATGNITGGNLTTAGITDTGSLTASTTINATGNITGGNLNTAGITNTGSLTASTTIDATGNITGGNLVTAGITSTGSLTASTTINATGNITGGNIDTAGQMVATGNITGGNLTTAGVTDTGSLTASTTIDATGNITGGNVNTAGQVAATGNVTGGNVNATSAITAGTTINATGNITGGNLTTAGITSTGSLTASTTINATGNITGGNLITTGVTLTGVLETTGNALIGGNLIVNGNITYINIDDLRVEDPIIILGTGPNGAPLTVDDGKDRGVYMEYFDSGLGNAFVGFINSTGNMVIANDVFFTGNDVVGINAYGTLEVGNVFGESAVFIGNVNAGNIISAGAVIGNVEISGNLVLGNLSVTGVINTTGNITGGNLVSNTAITAGTTIDATGNITGGNLVTAGITSTGSLTASTTINATGNITGGNLTTAGITSTGSLTASTTINATGNITGGNIDTAGITSTGSLTASTTINATGNITGGNIDTAGQVVATGNITGGNLTTAGITSTGSLTASTTINATGNITGGNVNTAGQVAATGNVTGGNLITAGLTSTATLSASGNANVGNLGTAGLIVATGNITGGNIDTAGQVVATGNITGGNLTTAGITSTGSLTASTTINATGNITGGNLSAGSGIISTTGNVNGGNVNATASVTGANLIATANVTGANVVGTTSGTFGNIVISGDDITDTNGRVNFNTAGADVDFAVNGDTTANIFYIDAGTGTASFGNATQTTGAVVAFNATSSVLMPVGNTAQRPTPNVTGMVRFNTTTSSLEFYDSTQWVSTGTIFTVVQSQTFNGDGSTLAFTINAGYTTASCLVSINGILQVPVTAYAVAGTTLTFTEAPAVGDLIEVREIVTTVAVKGITNANGSAVIEVTDSTADITTTGNIVPSGNSVFNLGSPTNQWNELFISGNSIYIGDVILKASAGNLRVRNFDDTADAGVEGTFISTSTTSGNLQIGLNHIESTNLNGNIELRPNGVGLVTVSTRLQVANIQMVDAGSNTVAFFRADGTTPATISNQNIDSTQVANGTSSLAVISSGGNIRANVGGATIATFYSGGINNGQANGVGNIGTSSSFFNTIFAKATSAQYADLAENYESDAMYEPGTVMCFGGSKEVTVCNVQDCTRIAGVVSTNPSYLMNSGQTGTHVAAVALQGRVPTKVTGQIRKGDLIVSAGDGRGRANNQARAGTIIGKALADFDGQDGVIEVVVGRV